MHRLSILFVVIIGGSGCFQSSQPEPAQTDAEIGTLAVLAATPTVPPTASPTIPPTAIPPTAIPPTAVPPTPIPPTAIPPTAVPTVPPAPTPLPPTPAVNRSAQQPADQSTGADTGNPTFIAEGEASRISDNFQGDLMANGQPYNKDALLAAHKELPFGTIVRVANLNTGLTVNVTITDRIPQTTRQVIDVSRAAAVALGMPDMGVAPVRLEVVP